MFKKLKEKAGNEILQVIVVIAVLGAITITICYALATQLRSSSSSAVTALQEGTKQIYTTP